MLRLTVLTAPALAILCFVALPVWPEAPEPNTSRDISSLTVPEGLQVTVWAEAPMFFNPTNIDFDVRGRVWVAEAVNYRAFRNRGRKPLSHTKGDRVMILEDSDGDGKAELSKVFVQDADLVAPLGLAVIGNRVFVSCSPHLLLYVDEDGDDRPDRKEKFLTGFGGHDHDHGLHALVAGPGGWFYFNAGNAGPHVVTDKSGWTLRAGSWYSGGSPHNTRNSPSLKSGDGRIYVGGLAMRIRPDGTGLSVIGHNFRNSYEICVDSFGNVWQNDNDDVVSCRTTWLMEYGNAGYSSADGKRNWQIDRRPGQATPVAHWRQEDPGVIPSGDVYGPGAPTGIAVYENGLLPEKFTGMVLSCEAGRNVVWGYLPEPQGAGFKLERFPFLTSVKKDDVSYKWQKVEQDQRKWFRPSDVAVGPDGAVYVADWFDPIVGGHAMHDTAGTGTIYRIAAGSRKGTVPRMDLSTPDGQIAALKSPAPNVRFLGFERLADRGDAALPVLERLLLDDNPRLAARAVYLMARLGPAGRDKAVQLLKDKREWMRTVSFRALRRAGHEVRGLAKDMASDPSPAARREVALAMRDMTLEESQSILVEIAEGYRGGDRWYLEALGTGCEGKEVEMYGFLLGRMGAPPLQWSKEFADIAWRLHPATSGPAFKDRALAQELADAQRKQAIDALAFSQDKFALRALKDVATRGPDDLRSYAAWWVNKLGGGTGKGTVHRGTSAKPPGKPRFASDVIRKGHVDIDIDIAGAKRLWLVAGAAGNGISCDWADWVNPILVGPKGEMKLTDLKWERASTGYGKLNINRNCRDLPLKVGGKVYGIGIGTHADSAIVYNIAGKGFTRFRARAGVDNGGPKIGGSDHVSKTSSVRFFVYTEGPSKDEQLHRYRKILLDPKADDARRIEAATELAKTKEGGRILLGLAAGKKLPAAVKALVGKQIFRNPDLAVRALASQYFPRPGKSGKPYPSIEQLLKMEGNPDRGKKLFFDAKASCAACHKIEDKGRDIGPDMSKIGLKYDRRALFDSILNPSAGIATGYETFILVTEDEMIFSGFIMADGEDIVIRDTSGETHKLPRKNIVSRKQQEISAMPDNIALGLDPQELADLVEFLRGLK